jgi:hypothetical protein
MNNANTSLVISVMLNTANTLTDISLVKKIYLASVKSVCGDIAREGSVGTGCFEAREIVRLLLLDT